MKKIQILTIVGLPPLFFLAALYLLDFSPDNHSSDSQSRVLHLPEIFEERSISDGNEAEVDETMEAASDDLTNFSQSHNDTNKPSSYSGPRLANPTSFSALLEEVLSSDVDEPMAHDQIIAAWSVCSSMPDFDSSDPRKTVSINKLKAFCDVEDINSLLSSWDNSGYVAVLKAVENEVNFEDFEGALAQIENTLRQARSIGELQAAAAWLIELAYSGSMPRNILDLDGVPLSEAHLAAQDAVRIYYCRSIGGCDGNHFETLVVCATIGCESFVDDIEQAIFRATPPRQYDLINQLLALFHQTRFG